jgi:CubicO group peptidase (beta-lactamase class C family)
MTLLSDRPADRIRSLLHTTDPGAAWATGGPDGPDPAEPGPGGAREVAGAGEVAGLAPVLALWPVLGSLVTEGELRLHTPLARYGPGASAGTPDGTTAHHLLTHPAVPAVAAALTRLAEHLAGGPLDELAAARIWRPLGMHGTGFTPEGVLHAPLDDLVRFLSHLLSPADHPVSRAWTAESLRIRTGELTPARGLLWHPAPGGVWAHQAPEPGGPALWIAPRRRRWAVLLPARPAGPMRAAFREAAFA